jgi:hypothetical protein
VLAHPPSPRSPTAGASDSEIEGRQLIVGPSRADRDLAGEPEQASKVGGEAGLLQPGEGLVERLSADGLGFLFQLNELDHHRGMNIGTYRYAGGSVYVFCAFSASAIPDPRRTAAFWQRT